MPTLGLRSCATERRQAPRPWNHQVGIGWGWHRRWTTRRSKAV